MYASGRHDHHRPQNSLHRCVLQHADLYDSHCWKTRTNLIRGCHCFAIVCDSPIVFHFSINSALCSPRLSSSFSHQLTANPQSSNLSLSPHSCNLALTLALQPPPPTTTTTIRNQLVPNHTMISTDQPTQDLSPFFNGSEETMDVFESFVFDDPSLLQSIFNYFDQDTTTTIESPPTDSDRHGSGNAAADCVIA